MKISESYNELSLGLQDIRNEAEYLQVLDVGGKKYNIQFYLGGDMKFLAVVCGIESATSEYACIWCKYSGIPPRF